MANAGRTTSIRLRMSGPRIDEESAMTSHNIENFAIPKDHRARIIADLGEDAALKRFQTLERLTYAYARRWSLRVRQVADSSNISLCIYCTDPGRREAVLKLPVDRESGRREHAALSTWGKTGAAPRVLQFDPVSGVILMERLFPGRQAQAAAPAELAEQINDLASRLYGSESTSPSGLDTGVFPPLADRVATRVEAAHQRLDVGHTSWYSTFFKPADARREEQRLSELIDDATAKAQHLLERQRLATLLHGDLLPRNVLTAEKATLRWMVIDPLPVIGDPHADVAHYFATQAGHDPAELIAALAADPRWDEATLRDWTYVWAVLSYDPELPAAARQRAFVEAVRG